MKTSSCLQSLFTLLEDHDISYRLVEVEQDKKHVELFIHPDSKDDFNTVMETAGWNKIGSNTQKFNFIYRLIPDAFWGNSDQWTLHSACQMGCQSLSNLSKCMLPLDKSVQNSIWNNKIRDKEYNCWRLTDEDYLIYLLATAMFDEKCFDKETILKINALGTEILDSSSLQKKLEGVFFYFTSELIQHIKEGRFSEMFHDFMTFRKY